MTGFNDGPAGEDYANREPRCGPEVTSFLQAAMDAAWDQGLRPSRMQDERHLTAHLKDMREITRHLLKMKPGE